MTYTPATRLSLIARLKNLDDQLAWEEFVEIYRPVVFRIGIRKGLQPADAEDVAQRVLFSVAQAIEHWEPDPARARFRTWLNRVARNAAINALTRGKPDQGSGDSKHLALMAQIPDSENADSVLIELEHRRECFRVAAKQIENEFAPDTWQAFWLTAVDGKSVPLAAQQLGKKPGSIYTARSRVMKRLQNRVAEMTDF